jgi:hypothetical protein
MYLANILIPWGNIRSLVQFPHRNGFAYEEDGWEPGARAVFINSSLIHDNNFSPASAGLLRSPSSSVASGEMVNKDLMKR